MTFKLSRRSLRKLKGVDPKLVYLVKVAITKTNVDFGVVCGLRTMKEQIELVEQGASKTYKSKHLEGLAVDLMAYCGSRPSWEISLYDDIAEAMAESARELNVKVRWGAAWTVPNIAEWNGTMEEAMNSYIDLRRMQNRRPFIDAPHFEIIP